MRRIVVLASLLALMIMPGLVLAKRMVALSPLPSVFHVLPPLGEDSGQIEPIDQAITDFLAAGYSATSAAQILKNRGYGAKQTYDVLTQVYQLNDALFIEQILGTAGYTVEEYLPFTALPSIQRFAPVLMFDSEYLGVPMSAQVYFDEAMEQIIVIYPDGAVGGASDGMIIFYRKPAGMRNYSIEQLSDVPTYVRAKIINYRLVIEYWWFYGFQEPCCENLYKGCYPEGWHHADWEHIKVTLNEVRTQVDAVTFYYHGDWYTRKNGGYAYWTDPTTNVQRPAIYVGKHAHGSYHDQTHSCHHEWEPICGIGRCWYCCEFSDCRNPADEDQTLWVIPDENFKFLDPIEGKWEEKWMEAEQIGSTIMWEGNELVILSWQWGAAMDGTQGISTHPTTKEFDENSCNGSGCNGVMGSGCDDLPCAYNEECFDQGWPPDEGLRIYLPIGLKDK